MVGRISSMLGSAAPGHLADSAPFLLLLGTVGPLPLGWSYCVYESWTPRLPGTEGGRDPRFCSLPLSLDVGGGADHLGSFSYFSGSGGEHLRALSPWHSCRELVTHGN